jgi:N-methylhydantoinase A
MAEAFHRQHETEYGHFFADSPIEIVNIRMTGVGRTQKIEQPAPLQAGSLDDAYIKTSNSVFRVASGLQTFETKFYQRERLPLSESLHGPAIIVQTDSTTVIPPGCHTKADPYGSLIITIGDYA